MSDFKITKCTGEGQGSCKRCNDHGIWNRHWMSMLYKIEGYEGCYCPECVKKIMDDNCPYRGQAIDENLEVIKAGLNETD